MTEIDLFDGTYHLSPADKGALYETVKESPRIHKLVHVRFLLSADSCTAAFK